nr:MAG TPA: hypothetical protein [Caudoviricetes sp.]
MDGVRIFSIFATCSEQNTRQRYEKRRDCTNFKT